MSFRVYGLSALIGPRAEIITGCGVFYAGANMFLSQDFCLLYRFASIHGQRMNDLFSSTKIKVFLFIFGQLISLLIFTFAHSILVPPEVILTCSLNKRRVK